jgi:hypothetical protein
MSWLVTTRSFKAMVAVAAVFAWIVGTNHCLLPLEKNCHAIATSHCPGHSHGSSAGAESSSGMLSCCQGLLSTDSKLVLNKIYFPVHLTVIQLLRIDLLARPDRGDVGLRMAEYNTGPPPFFIRTVLRRSLPENAPPACSFIS